MEIKYKLYPYPVLSSFSDDYKKGKFDVTIEPVRDGYNLRIDFLATLTCASLMELIKSGAAKYVYHMECSQTGFRTVFQTDKTQPHAHVLTRRCRSVIKICRSPKAPCEPPQRRAVAETSSNHAAVQRRAASRGNGG